MIPNTRQNGIISQMLTLHTRSITITNRIVVIIITEVTQIPAQGKLLVRFSQKVNDEIQRYNENM